MSVYVDNIIEWQSTGIHFRGREQRKWCHMIADTAEELHAMAERIGMRRAWFQTAGNLPHYDLTPTRRASAIRAGARPLERSAFVAKMREIRTAWKIGRFNVSHGGGFR